MHANGLPREAPRPTFGTRAEDSPAPGRRAALLTALTLGVSVVVAAAHWPALSCRAFTFDDQQYVTVNHLVRNPSWNSVARFFGEVVKPSTVQGYYQPLTMVSLMLDWAAGGRPDNLRPFHRTSLTLHVLNSALVIVFLYLLLGRPWPAALAGLLFGVHPLTVETVVWLSERKTLLATLFTLGSLIAYLWAVRRPDWSRYALSLVLFALALLCKPTSTPLPVLLLLLDYWPLRRLSVRAVLAKIPFFVVGGISAIITIISQAQAASVTMPHEYTPLRIPLTLCHNIVFYLCKMVWPTNLTSHYPFPKPFDLSNPWLLACVGGTVALLVILLLSLRWTRALLTGWLFFFVAILPTMGVIGFTVVIASDKYVYLPVLGLLMCLTAALTRLWGQPGRRAAGRRLVLVLVVVLLAGGATRGTRQQLGYWRDTETLYRHMLAIAPGTAMLHSDFGDELARQGRLPEAVEQYTLALRSDPSSYNAHNGLGIALLGQGNLEAALPHFQTALGLNPGRGAAYAGLGTVLARQGRLDEAFDYFQKALELDPHIADVHGNLGAILARRGDYDGAIAHYREALRLKPEFAAGHHNLAIALFKVGKLEEAAVHLREAIRLQPNYVSAYRNLGLVLMAQEKIDQAIWTYQAGLRVAPDDPGLRAGLAEALTKRETPTKR
jgi:tetratricopeptide (TPR) repeat protein